MLAAFAQVGAFDFRVMRQVGGGAFQGDFACLHDIGAVGDLESGDGVLFHQQHGEAQVLHFQDFGKDFLDQQRRQAHGRLVQQQQTGAAHQGAGEGQHLLLAAGERAAQLLQALAQAREAAQHDIHLQDAVWVVVAADEQVLAHGHVGEDHFALGHKHGRVADAPPGGLASREPATDEHRARPRLQQPDNGFEQGGLARAVRAEQADDLPGADVQARAVDDLKAAVAAPKILYLKKHLETLRLNTR